MRYNPFGYRFFSGTSNYDGDVFIYSSQGQLIAKYSILGNTLKLDYLPIYEGSKRIGIVEPEGVKWEYCPDIMLCPKEHSNITVFRMMFSVERYRYGLKASSKYELTDHLGNVRVVIANQRVPVSENGITVAYYKPLVKSINDYYPFGWEKQLRTVNPYPFNYQGQLFDADLGWQYYRYRNYDPIIARFHQVEPLIDSFPMWSGYGFVMYNPTIYRESEGESPHLILQYGVNVGLNVLTQMVVAYLFDPGVNSWAEAWDRVDLMEAFVEGAVDMLPGKKMQMAINAASQMLMYMSKVGIENVTTEGLLVSGMVGLLEPVIGDAISKYGTKKVAWTLAKKMSLDAGTIRRLTGHDIIKDYAEQVAKALGGEVKKAKKGDGWKVETKDYIVRIMYSSSKRKDPYFRILHKKKGAIDASGTLSSDRVGTHMNFVGDPTESILKIIEKNKETIMKKQNRSK